MIVIIDSGPLIALAKLGILYLLPCLYGQVSFPTAVFTEVVVRGRERGYNYSDMPDARSIREIEDLSKTITVNPEKNLEEGQASVQMKKSVFNSPSSAGGLGQRLPEEPWRSISLILPRQGMIFIHT